MSIERRPIHRPCWPGQRPGRKIRSRLACGPEILLLPLLVVEIDEQKVCAQLEPGPETTRITVNEAAGGHFLDDFQQDIMRPVMALVRIVGQAGRHGIHRAVGASQEVFDMTRVAGGQAQGQGFFFPVRILGGDVVDFHRVHRQSPAATNPAQ